MAYYVDFVGLNTFIYEPVGWSPEDQFSSGVILKKFESTNWKGTNELTPVAQNTIGLDYLGWIT